MPRRQMITQAAIARAVKGAQAAGLKVERVEIDGDRIVIHSGEVVSAGEPTLLAQWRAGRGSR